MKRWLLAALTTLFSLAAQAQYVTLTGTVQGSNGVTAQNYTLSFTPNQVFFIAGTSVVIGTTTNCATSTDGSVVAVPNPLQTVVISPNFTGTLPPGNYYVEYTFYTASTETLPSPEMQVQLTSTGQLIVNSPAGGVPAGALGMRIYIGATSGSETGQGQTIGNGGYAQSSPLGGGVPLPTVNNTVCKQVANDAGWPTGTGYKVGLADSSGNSVPGYPMLWQLLGPNTTINLSNGLPYYHGVVTFPSPLLASPYNHNTQSVSGPFDMSGYNLVNVGRLGVGTSTPAWGIDVVGFINATQGYLYNGNSGSIGQCLVSNGTAFIPGTCGTAPTLYYQHIAGQGFLKPQEPYLNFDGNFNTFDNPGSLRTEIQLNPTTVTAGSYTSTNLTVDANGRITAATNGTSIPVIQPLVITSGICTTTNTAGAYCGPVTVTWPTAFANTAYSVSCSTFTPNGTGGAQPFLALYVGGKTTTTFQYTLQNGQGSQTGAYTVAEIDCIGMHP